MRKTERRTFLKTTGLGTIVWGLTDRASHAASGQQKLVVGVIGTGGMGSSHTRELAGRADVELAYVCDVDQNRLKKGRDLAESRAGTAPRAVKDMRRIFDDKRIDAVYIATPDHWHAPAAILALDAGKHVYVEKPCCHNINLRVSHRWPAAWTQATADFRATDLVPVCAGRLRSRGSLLRHERDARVERVLRFDPETESITEDDVANHLVRRQYRNGHWAVPQGA